MPEDEVLYEGLNVALDLIIKKGRERLLAQGHKATGKLIETFSGEVKKIGDDFIAEGSYEKYGIYQDTGVVASRIPFKEGSGAKTSLYIEALIAWVMQKKMETEIDKAKGAAFAIAKTHKLKGMHTKNSLPAPGQQGWISQTLDENEAEIVKIVNEAAGKNMNIVLDTIINKAQQELLKAA